MAEVQEGVWVEKAVEESAEESLGPKPLPTFKPTAATESTDYGGALLPGEGAAIAQYVQQNKRIPRRGEVGLTADEIDRFEGLGFVMSGNRHKRMNAVRIRKENQVYSAEEKRALALLKFEEKAKRENKVIGEFREMLQSKLHEHDDGQSKPPK